MTELLDKSAPIPQPGVERKSLQFEEVIGPEHLKMISRASGGFRIVEDPALAAKFTETGTLSTGFTYIFPQGGGEIHFNPLLRTGIPELGIQPWTRADIQGFAFHEAGHHAPEVLDFQRKLVSIMGNPDLVPPPYKTSPRAEEKFWRAINSHLNNGVIDIWDEAYMGRRPYFSIERVIREFQSAKGEMDDYTHLSMPEQLIQITLRGRYLEQKEVEKKVAPGVYQAYKKFIDSGAIQAIMSRREFENPFAAPLDRKKSIQGKVDAYTQVFLPEYIKLMEEELEKRKQDKQQEKQPKQPGQQGEQEEQEQSMSGGEGAVPLTDEEEQQLVEQILSQLEEAGKEYESQTLSEEEKNELDQKLQQIKQSAEKRQTGEEQKPEPSEPGEPEEESGLEAIKRRAEELRRQDEERAKRGMAEALGVSRESIEKWETIKEKYKLEIESTAAVLADIFLDDRRKRLEYLRREGEVVPGLEFETIAALISGELDPETRMIEVRNPEFLETELEFIVDTSGSMYGRPLDKSVETMVIVTEAFKRVRESLEEEQLLNPESEQPFRVGVTKFSTQPERVTRLAEPLNDKKQLTIIEGVSEVGGGTEETGAISQVYEELTLNRNNVIKLMIVLTDGAGNREGLRLLMRQIEDDKEVVFMAVGIGTGAEGIVKSYIDPLKDREGNVFGHAAKDPDKILEPVLQFLKREVGKRKSF
ncbi:hypothetical protein A2631_02215 [Candidatus Daviesbacteria bacterium RIFCSPHIGHO2_01_FULL_44_29]|uniref:VWFA domain-containing protein n=1 Tax=Candidatus Daviesbacteria bacterium RIFCSPHIGHO2_02_FULL_43_12 TaxID=1797776 RepID=A0A1F5KJU3_9BACT|nr:MAG: hypothetical protein A2631_02215 [Candidatus Daviesbacteria bacterium RIFCSPHIGHO2_01_FULL_44_29]OGE41207.1 MAG: hypothetical protein A3D25_01610 [Candidatus Daviesbacteria bacterium RIFCSPHIGHO2_02_FULL_43_12]OGE69407.1 MAG: hypothetical protein A3B55_03350 [Candidatus Daviesbacteria bacterium RIFCSPLOWO2_01_FULL_43_15]